MTTRTALPVRTHHHPEIAGDDVERFEGYVDEIKRLMGITDLDADEFVDGFSIDSASDAFDEGLSAAEYAAGKRPTTMKTCPRWAAAAKEASAATKPVQLPPLTNENAAHQYDILGLRAALARCGDAVERNPIVLLAVMESDAHSAEESRRRQYNDADQAKLMRSASDDALAAVAALLDASKEQLRAIHWLLAKVVKLDPTFIPPQSPVARVFAEGKRVLALCGVSL